MDARIKSGHDKCVCLRIHLDFQTAPCRYSFAISPRVAREFCFEFLPLRNQRAQGMPGAQCARSLACKM
jgi:hypothetical protein